ncbi:MAG: hypothetical protein PVI57_21180 [Gemmatimonadota bacterium]
MDRDPVVDLTLRAVVGVGALLGIAGLAFLVTGNPGAFFGFAVVGGGFAGLGWAGRRLMAPEPEPNAASTVGGVVFGGAGAVMLIGGVALLVQGEFGGAVGLGVFGLVFCGAGYGAYRVFRVPEGTRRVLVGEREQTFRGRFGQAGRRRSRTYRYVDADVPDREVEAMQRRWASEPWTRRDDWAAGRVVQGGTGSVGLLIGFTVAWNVIAWGIAAVAIGSEWGGGDVPWWVLVFPLVGLALGVATVRTWIRGRKFGVSVLELETVPARPGDRLRGVVRTGVSPRHLPSGQGFTVRLRCVRRASYRDRDGDTRVSEETLWLEEEEGQGRVGRGRGVDVPVDVLVPADAPSTEMLPEDDRVLWRLELWAPVPGVDYAAQFEVPVFGPHPERGAPG